MPTKRSRRRKAYLAGALAAALVICFLLVRTPSASQGLDASLGLYVSQGIDVSQGYECSNSRKDTLGLLCVPNLMWSAILREDAARWKRIAEKIGSSFKLYSYRQTVWTPTFSCPLEHRFGELGDGGKWLCNGTNLGGSSWNSTHEQCLVYSFGCGGLFGFEVELLMRTNGRCEVHLFDTDASKWRAPKIAGLHTYSFGVVGERDEADRQKSYSTLLRMLKHENRRMHLVKIDIEFSEMDVLPDILALPASRRPQQIVVEIHWWAAESRPSWRPMDLAGMQRMDRMIRQFRDAGYVLFHMEPNILDQFCTEFSFLHLDSRTTR